MKSYQELSAAKKRQARAMMKRVTEMRRKQLDDIIEGIERPLRDAIRAEKLVTSGQLPIAHWVAQQEEVSRHIQAIFKRGAK